MDLDNHALRGVQVYCDPGGLSYWAGDQKHLIKQVIVHPTGVLERIEVGLNTCVPSPSSDIVVG